MKEIDKMMEVKMDIDSLIHSAQAFKRLIENPNDPANTFKKVGENERELKRIQLELMIKRDLFSEVLIAAQKEVNWIVKESLK